MGVRRLHKHMHLDISHQVTGQHIQQAPVNLRMCLVVYQRCSSDLCISAGLCNEATGGDMHLPLSKPPRHQVSAYENVLCVLIALTLPVFHCASHGKE